MSVIVQHWQRRMKKKTDIRCFSFSSSAAIPSLFPILYHIQRNCFENDNEATTPINDNNDPLLYASQVMRENTKGHQTVYCYIGSGVDQRSQQDAFGLSLLWIGRSSSIHLC